MGSNPRALRANTVVARRQRGLRPPSLAIRRGMVLRVSRYLTRQSSPNWGRSFGVLCLLSLAGCKGRPAPTEQPREFDQPLELAPAPSPSGGSDSKLFGAPLAERTPTPLDQLLKNPRAYETRVIQVSGEVRRACSKKGCWMELATSRDASSPGCRVTFQDYAFFVPTDAAGAHAKLDALVTVKTLKKSHVDHLEAEGATFASKNPDGSAEEIQLVATGVELKRGGA